MFPSVCLCLPAQYISFDRQSIPSRCLSCMLTSSASDFVCCGLDSFQRKPADHACTTPCALSMRVWVGNGSGRPAAISRCEICQNHPFRQGNSLTAVGK